MRIGVFFICFLVLSSCRNDNAITTKTISKEKQQAALGTFTTVNYEGLEKRLENTTSEITVVNFWATWCKPCIKELPYFEQVQQKYLNDEVQVLLVSLDFPDQRKQLETFIEKRGLKSEIILLDDADANSWINKVDKNWTGAIPATIIFNKSKRSFYERSFTLQELEEEINNFKS